MIYGIKAILNQIAIIVFPFSTYVIRQVIQRMISSDICCQSRTITTYSPPTITHALRPWSPPGSFRAPAVAPAPCRHRRGALDRWPAVDESCSSPLSARLLFGLSVPNSDSGKEEFVPDCIWDGGQMHLLVQRGRASWRVGPHPSRLLPRSEAAMVTTPSRTRVLAPIVFLRCDVTPSHRSTKRALLVPSSARAPDEARVGDSPLLRLDLQRRVCRRPSVGVVRSMMTREKVPYILHRFPLNVQNFLLRFYLSKF
jgi:hypothetical protein